MYFNVIGNLHLIFVSVSQGRQGSSTNLLIHLVDRTDC